VEPEKVALLIWLANHRGDKRAAGVAEEVERAIDRIKARLKEKQTKALKGK
jgi:hypothetical protein